MRSSSRSNPCPVCGRTKDSDCRIKETEAGETLVLCHGNTEHRKGDVLSDDWAFLGRSKDGRCGVFRRNRPQGKLLQAETPRDPAEQFPAALGTCERIAPHKPNQRGITVYDYSPHQRVIRREMDAATRKKKTFLVQHRDATDATGMWEKGAGEEPWPFYGQIPTGTTLALEVEGEKCVDVLQAVGIPALSSPGHDRTHESMVQRYRRLTEYSISELVFIADEDRSGRLFAERVREAAEEAGMTVWTPQAGEIWPGIEKGGSVDDVPVETLRNTISRWIDKRGEAKDRPPVASDHSTPGLMALRQEIERMVAAGDLDTAGKDLAAVRLADKYNLRPAEVKAIAAALGAEEHERWEREAAVAALNRSDQQEAARANLLTLEYLLPPPLVEPLRYVTEGKQTDALSSAITFLCAMTAAIKAGTLIRGDYRDFAVPPNMYLALIGKSGMGKSPLLSALVDRPLDKLRERQASLNQTKMKMHQEKIAAKLAKATDVKFYPKVTITDTTGEALIRVLSENDHDGAGLLLVADELASFFQGLDLYHSSGRGKSAGAGGVDEKQMLKLYDGKRVSLLRAGIGELEVARPQFGIVGGMQPRVFQALAKSGDPSGFYARFFLCPLPNEIKFHSSDQPEDAIELFKEHESFLQDFMLNVNDLGPNHYILSKTAMGVMDQIRYKSTIAASEAELDEQSSVYGKRVGQTLRLAGMLHIAAIACGHAENQPVISLETLNKAFCIVEHLQAYALSAHETASRTPTDGRSLALMDSIQRNCTKKKPLTASEFRSRHCRSKALKWFTAAQVMRHMEELVKHEHGEFIAGVGGVLKYSSNDHALGDQDRQALEKALNREVNGMPASSSGEPFELKQPEKQEQM